MCSRFNSFSVQFLVVLLSVVWVNSACAIPAFSRQHKTECTTCHTIYPELNEYGESFRKNGFVYFTKEPAGGTAQAVAEVKDGGSVTEQPEKLKSGAVVTTGGTEQGAGQRGKQNEGLWLAA